MVVTQQRALSNFLLKNLHWWSELRHVITFLQPREQVHSAWRVIGRERQLGVIPLRQASAPPFGSSYRVLYRKPYLQAFDPKYVISVSAPPPPFARGYCFGPITSASFETPHPLNAGTGASHYGVGTAGRAFPYSLVSLSALRAALSDTSRTTPYRDLIEYPTVSLPNNEHMSILANFYNRLLSGRKVENLPFGGFTLLPKKSPHGLVVNGRPLSNLSVIWKLFSMVITKALHTWMTDYNHISRTRMAMQCSTSVVDPQRVIFDWIQQRWWSGLWAFLLLDDVVHALGSMSQETLRPSLLSAGVHPSLTGLVVYAVQHLTLHMGGQSGSSPFSGHV